MEEDIINYSIYSLGELQEIIGNMEDYPPKDKRTKEFQDWKTILNNIFNIYNQKAQSKIYSKIK